MPGPSGSPEAPPERPAAAAAVRVPTWGAEALWHQLEPLLPGLGVEVLARLESTNSELLERARGAGRGTQRGTPRGSGRPGAPGSDARDSRSGAGTPSVSGAGSGPSAPSHGRRAEDAQPCLLVAEHQTRGRGRLGRDWRSSAGASLTFSLSLPMQPRDWSGLSLAVGVAIADALDPLTDRPPRIALKWPNDLWLQDAPGRGRKLGGILIETVAQGDRRTVVVGIGLNIRPLPGSAGSADPDAGLAHGLACLEELDPAATAPGALSAIALPLVQALQRFEREGFAGSHAAYARRDLLAGQPLTTLGGTQSWHGRGEGIGEDGALLLRLADGTLERIVSGEVSVRLASSPAADPAPHAGSAGTAAC